MKTADLEGDDLDFWVAKAEGYTPEREDFGVGANPRYAKGWIVYLPEPKIIGTSLLGRDKSLHSKIIAGRYSPSNNWAQGGPIKEKKRIGTYWIEEENQWRAGIAMHGYTPEFDIAQQHGPTELVAAMRAFVNSKFGDEAPTSPSP